MPIVQTVLNAKEGVNVSDATAAVGDVLTPYTFYSGSSTKKTGTMANASYGSVLTPGTSQQQIASGYHSGSGSDAVAGDTNLVAGNIASGVTIFGVTGSYTGVGTATAAQVLTGYTFSNSSSSDISGSMPNASYSSPIVPSTANQYIATGYHSGSSNDYVEGDTNLVAGNIASGVTIFGVTGTYTGGSLSQDILTMKGYPSTFSPSTYTSMYYYSAGITGSSSQTPCSITPTFATTAMVVLTGVVVGQDGNGSGSSLKLQLTVSGVQIAESAYIASYGVNTSPVWTQITGTYAVSGATACTMRIYNYNTSTINIYYFMGENAPTTLPPPTLLMVTSIKST